MGKRPIKKWQLQQMAIELEHRGRDATGFAVMQEGGGVAIWKVDKPAWHAVATQGFHEWADTYVLPKTQILLVHTRAFTKGSPHMLENNHPLYAEDIGGIVVHNGMVRNDDELFKKYEGKPGFKRSCATDSDAFRAILDNYGRVDKGLIKQMQMADATAAVCAVHRNSPGKLLVLRDQNPFVLGATQDTLAGASTKEALHKVLKPWIKLHNLDMQVHAPDLSFLPMRNETGYIIGPRGVEVHELFKCNGRVGGGYTKYYKAPDYYARQLKAANMAASEKRYSAHAPNAPNGVSVNPTTKAGAGKVTTLVDEGGSAAGVEGANMDHKGGGDTYSPVRGLFDWVICPRPECSRHVQLSDEDKLLDDIKLLVCKECGTNLAGALPAGLVH